jgi:hypothetical protein
LFDQIFIFFERACERSTSASASSSAAGTTTTASLQQAALHGPNKGHSPKK